jgi:hypothetical protein
VVDRVCLQWPTAGELLNEWRLASTSTPSLSQSVLASPTTLQDSVSAIRGVGKVDNAFPPSNFRPSACGVASGCTGLPTTDAQPSFGYGGRSQRGRYGSGRGRVEQQERRTRTRSGTGPERSMMLGNDSRQIRRGRRRRNRGEQGKRASKAWKPWRRPEERTGRVLLPKTDIWQLPTSPTRVSVYDRVSHSPVTRRCMSYSAGEQSTSTEHRAQSTVLHTTSTSS